MREITSYSTIYSEFYLIVLRFNGIFKNIRRIVYQLLIGSQSLNFVITDDFLESSLLANERHTLTSLFSKKLI